MTVGILPTVTALVGALFGWGLSFLQQRVADRKAAEEAQLAQIQQLVSAVSELQAQRQMFEAAWMSWRTRLLTLSMAVVEFGAAWQGSAWSWDGARPRFASAARVVHTWQRRTVEQAMALAPYMARVGAAGLPLGMSKDRAVARAAQRLMDAALEGRPAEELHAATRELRVAHGLPAVEPDSPNARSAGD